MTTVAYKNGAMAADTLISADGDPWAQGIKIKKIKGWLIGACGSSGLCAAFLQKFDPKVIEEKRYIPIVQGERDEDFEGLIVSPKGKIFHITHTGVFEQVKSYGYIAIGGGSNVAMGAMYVGGSAVEAVKAAMRHSSGTGGRVQKIKLGK